MADHDAVDTAWRIHSAIESWTARVDSKASFALGIQSAIIAGLLVVTADGRRMADLNGVPVVLLFWAGVASLIAAVVMVMLVVRPWVRSDKVSDEAKDNFVFFGHLKYWDPHELASALQERDVLPVMARQLVVTSRIAWRKHRLVQASMTTSSVGVALVGLAAALNG